MIASNWNEYAIDHLSIFKHFQAISIFVTQYIKSSNCPKCLHSRLLHGWPIIIKLFRSRPCLRVDDRFFDKMPWKPSITKVQWKSAKIHNSNLYEDFFCEKCSFCLIMMSSSWLLKIDLELINEFDDWRCFDFASNARTLESIEHFQVPFIIV